MHTFTKKMPRSYLDLWWSGDFGSCHNLNCSLFRHSLFLWFKAKSQRNTPLSSGAWGRWRMGLLGESRYFTVRALCLHRCLTGFSSASIFRRPISSAGCCVLCGFLKCLCDGWKSIRRDTLSDARHLSPNTGAHLGQLARSESWLGFWQQCQCYLSPSEIYATSDFHLLAMGQNHWTDCSFQWLFQIFPPG